MEDVRFVELQLPEGFGDGPDGVEVLLIGDLGCTGGFAAVEVCVFFHINF